VAIRGRKPNPMSLGFFPATTADSHFSGLRRPTKQLQSSKARVVIVTGSVFRGFVARERIVDSGKVFGAWKATHVFGENDHIGAEGSEFRGEAALWRRLED